MTFSLILVLIFAISFSYLLKICRKQAYTETESGAAIKSPTSAPNKQESVRSIRIREKFSIPDRGGKVSIAIEKVFWILVLVASWLTMCAAGCNQTALLEDFDNTYDGLSSLITILCETCMVFILIHSCSDEEENMLSEVVKEKFPAIEAHRLLHHESNIGKIAFVRQIVPHLHIEYDFQTQQILRPHIKAIVLYQVGANASSVETMTIKSIE